MGGEIGDLASAAHGFVAADSAVGNSGLLGLPVFDCVELIPGLRPLVGGRTAPPAATGHASIPLAAESVPTHFEGQWTNWSGALHP